MPSRTEHPLPVSPTPHGWVVGSRGAAAAVCLPASPRQHPARPAAHLYPVVGEEGLGVGLGGQVQAGGPAPAAAAAHQQGEGAGLAVAVALGEEAWGGPAAGTGRPPPALPRARPQAPAPASRACDTWMLTSLTRPFRLLPGPWSLSHPERLPSPPQGPARAKVWGCVVTAAPATGPSWEEPTGPGGHRGHPAPLPWGRSSPGPAHPGPAARRWPGTCRGPPRPPRPGGTPP